MTYVIEANHLTKCFGDEMAVNDVTFGVAAGEVVGYLGPNGAGKSTTLRMLLGLLRPTSGEALISGAPAGSREARLASAYVPGDVALWPQLTGREAVGLLTRLHGSLDEKYRDELFTRFDLDPEKRIRSYSKGNRQKVAIVAALATRAPALLFDEPTSGLDPLMEKVFQECVLEARDRGQAVLLSSHIISEVEQTCKRVVMIRGGQLVSTDPIEKLREHLGVDVQLVGEIPDLMGVTGVSRVEKTSDGAHCHVTGSMAPLLQALARGTVSRIKTREASLEEIFLSYYEEASTK